jgi:2-C-methyl-D-erythritol 2,4-cyclodiphosphate synthase
MTPVLRIGHGFDAHRFGPGGHVVLGGVTIEHHQGVVAHSDGDVLIHALCDALLGAAGLGDIGRHFPDSDTQWKGADSRLLLRDVMRQLRDQGWGVANADLTLVAQAPRVARYVPAMCTILAVELQVSPAQVNVKATTTEHMGWIGRGEGLAAHAVVLLVQVHDGKRMEQDQEPEV